MGKGIGGHQSAAMGTDKWLTPPHILNALGEFDLDPCAAPEPRPWPTAIEHISPPDNGLKALRWWGRVWLNPPLGRETGKWLELLAEHGRGTALIFARTETEMFHKWVWGKAKAALFLRGRLTFYRPDGTRAAHNSGAPSVLVAYGGQDVGALACASDHLPGHFLTLNNPPRR